MNTQHNKLHIKSQSINIDLSNDKLRDILKPYDYVLIVLRSNRITIDQIIRCDSTFIETINCTLCYNLFSPKQLAIDCLIKIPKQ